MARQAVSSTHQIRTARERAGRKGFGRQFFDVRANRSTIGLAQSIPGAACAALRLGDTRLRPIDRVLPMQRLGVRCLRGKVRDPVTG